MAKYKLSIKEIEFDQLLERKVIKNNKTSGKICLPKDLIGKKVYVVIPTERDNE